MNAQVVDSQNNIWHMIINGKRCTFMIPIALYLENELSPLKPDVDNGFRWRVNRRWVSYKQIKNAILSYSDFI